MNTMARLVVIMGAVALIAVSFAGCGTTQSSSGGANPTPTLASISGPWDAFAGNSSFHANLTDLGNGKFSAPTANDVLVCPEPLTWNCTGGATVTGSVDANNKVTIKVSSLIPVSANATLTNATLTGTLNGTTMSGTFTTTSGGSGTWTASQAGTVTGTYTGTINSTVNPLAFPVTVSASLTENPTTEGISGQAVLTNSPCFVNLSFPAATSTSGGSYAVGGAFIVGDWNQEVFITGFPSPTGNNQYEVAYQVNNGGTCEGTGGGTFTKQ